MRHTPVNILFLPVRSVEYTATYGQSAAMLVYSLYFPHYSMVDTYPLNSSWWRGVSVPSGKCHVDVCFSLLKLAYSHILHSCGEVILNVTPCSITICGPHCLHNKVRHASCAVCPMCGELVYTTAGLSSWCMSRITTQSARAA